MLTDLFQFAYIPSWYEQLYELSKLAAPESWRFRQPFYETQNTETPILERYINQVFRKQAIEYSCAPEGLADQLFYLHQDFACFHTGLSTKDYKSIYMCFCRNKRLDSLDTVDNSQINVLTQRTMHRICTAATNEEVSFAYRVAIPRQRFRWRNAFSTRWRSL